MSYKLTTQKIPVSNKLRATSIRNNYIRKGKNARISKTNSGYNVIIKEAIKC